MFKLSGFADEISADINEQIRVLKEEGISYLELRGIWDKNVLDLTDEEIKKAKEEFKKNNIGVSAIGSPIGKISITDDFGPHLEKFKRALFVAKFFETPYIRIFSYYPPKGEKPEKYRDEVLRRMETKVKLAEKEKITLLHENERAIYGNSPERCRELHEKIKSKYFRAIFDPANYICDGFVPYPDAFKIMVNYIVYLHIKDAKFAKEEIIKPAGEGDGRIKETLIELKKKNFDGFLSIEPHLKYAGQYKGFSGPENFKIASKALKKILSEI